MKTKSKLVLGLSILSAATLAAGATSTFAWYQVSNNANLTGKAEQYAAFTASTDKKTLGDLKFSIAVTLTPFGNSGDTDSTNKPANLEMMTYSDGIKFGYYIQGEANPRLQESQFGSSPYWVVYKASVVLSGATISEVTYTAEQAAHLLHEANVSFGLQVAADSAVAAEENCTDAEKISAYNEKYGTNYASGDTLPAVTASRAKFYGSAVDSAETPANGVAPAQSGSTPLTLRTSSAVEDNTYQWTYYFGMYIEGAGINDGSTAPNGNFTVSFI